MNDDVPIEPRVIVAGGAEPPQDTICTTFSVTADEVLASSPFELAFESGVYAAVSVVLLTHLGNRQCARTRATGGQSRRTSVVETVRDGDAACWCCAA